MPAAVTTKPRSKKLPPNPLRPKGSTSRAPTSVRPHPSQQTQAPAPSLQLLSGQPQPQSPGLRILIALRKFSTPMALLMVVGVLPIYGWSASTQVNWGKRYDALEQLRRQERQAQTRNEILEHDVTEKAILNPQGYVLQGPTSTVFLPRSQARPPQKSAIPPVVGPITPAPENFPLAY